MAFVLVLVYGGLWAPGIGERVALRFARKGSGERAPRDREQ